jgi:hypothetical protein
LSFRGVPSGSQDWECNDWESNDWEFSTANETGPSFIQVFPGARDPFEEQAPPESQQAPPESQQALPKPASQKQRSGKRRFVLVDEDSAVNLLKAGLKDKTFKTTNDAIKFATALTGQKQISPRSAAIALLPTLPQKEDDKKLVRKIQQHQNYLRTRENQGAISDLRHPDALEHTLKISTGKP